MFETNIIFRGKLLHRRYQPKRHELCYQVANVLLDVDRLGELNRTSRLLGYNCRRLFTINDKNHGPGDGTPIAGHVRALMTGLKLNQPIARVFMLCYPAVFGKVFNPLTVYFGLAKNGDCVAAIYEVSNTFGERHSYVVPVSDAARHRVQKSFYVSPFNQATGEYRFGFEFHGGHLRLSIALFEQGRLTLVARIEAQEQLLTDQALLRGLFRMALQPIKVIAAVHWEAVKLYLKGLRPTSRPAHPRFLATESLSKHLVSVHSKLPGD